MHKTKRRNILTALNYSPEDTGGAGAAGGATTAAGQTAAGGAGGTQQPPAGVAPNSAAAQFAQPTPPAQQQATGDQQQDNGAKPPAGMVPVGELAGERKKRQDLETQLNQLTNGLKSALGLGDAQTPEQLQAAAAQYQTQLKQATAQLTVTKLAGDPAIGANVAALLDSQSFLDSLNVLDVSDTAAVKALVEATVKADPNRFGLAKVPPAGSGDAGQDSSGASGNGPDLNSLLRATRS